MPVTTLTPAAAAPVDLGTAKAHLRVEHSDEDGLILDLIDAAAAHVEQRTGRALVQRGLRLTLDRFDTVIRLPMPPLVQVDEIRYLDTDGVQQVLAASGYLVDIASTPARITVAPDADWPDTQAVTGAVEIDYQAGYGNADAVPLPIKQAILLLLGHWYENREAVITGPITSELPLAVDSLLAPYRVWYL